MLWLRQSTKATNYTAFGLKRLPWNYGLIAQTDKTLLGAFVMNPSWKARYIGSNAADGFPGKVAVFEHIIPRLAQGTTIHTAPIKAQTVSYKRIVALILVANLCLAVPLYAGLDSKKAAYQGGTQKDQYFAGAKEAVVGTLKLDDEKEMKFEYRVKKESKVFSIPYEQIIDLEYGQNAGRRVGAAIATAILISPVGLFLLFSKSESTS